MWSDLAAAYFNTVNIVTQTAEAGNHSTVYYTGATFNLEALLLNTTKYHQYTKCRSKISKAKQIEFTIIRNLKVSLSLKLGHISGIKFFFFYCPGHIKSQLN